LSGHIHPCVRLSGKARNSMTLPCFWFAEKFGVLPAFGDFTGTYRVVPKKGDQVYVCAGKTIKKV
jgi:metallophosphoesterase superfamily enzyme